MYKFITVVFSKLEFVDSMMDRVGKRQFDIYQTISSQILVKFFRRILTILFTILGYFSRFPWTCFLFPIDWYKTDFVIELWFLAPRDPITYLILAIHTGLGRCKLYCMQTALLTAAGLSVKYLTLSDLQ